MDLSTLSFTRQKMIAFIYTKPYESHSPTHSNNNNTILCNNNVSLSVLISRSSLSSLSCKNFNVAHYSKLLKISTINICNFVILGFLQGFFFLVLECLLIMTRCSYALFTLFFKQNDGHPTDERWYRMRCSCLYMY